MKTFKIVVITILSLGFLSAAALFLVGYLKPKPGGILVNSTPASEVYINNQLVGKTPYEGVYPQGYVSLKLIPEGGDGLLVPYGANINLVSGIKTVVRHEFGESEEVSSGDIVFFEREGGKQASMVVVSDPDNAQVSIDSTPRGFSPFKSSSIPVGEHQIIVKSSGFGERILTVNLIPGYKLTVYAKLAKIPEEPKVAAAVTEKKTFVEILDTPTGFLRVRSEPGSKGREIHQTKPGEKYLFLEEDSETGWYKIQIEDPKAGLPDGRSGWVSNEYSKKIEEEIVSDSQIPLTETPE